MPHRPSLVPVFRARPSRALLLTLLAWLAGAGASFAAAVNYSHPDYLIDSWESEHGLPESSATAITQTPDGYLWFGTFNGLVRYDGNRFVVFDPANTPTLPSAGIVNLHLDKAGRLWVSTLRGLAVREGNHWIPFGKEQGWTGDFARTFSDNAGVLCVTSFDGRVFRLADGKLKELAPPPGNRAGYYGHVDRAGTIWVAQDGFFGHWNEDRWMASPLMQVVTNGFLGAGQARDGSLLVASGGQLRRIEGSRQTGSIPYGPLRSRLWRVYEDGRGAFWLCTQESGLLGLLPDGSSQRFTTTNGLSHNGVRCAFLDREQNLWVGTSGGGLTRIKTRTFRSHIPAELAPTRRVTAVAEDGAGGVLLGTYGNGIARLNGNTLTRLLRPDKDNVVENCQVLLVDHTGQLWAGSHGDSIRILAGESVRAVPPTNAGGPNVTALFEDSRRRIWIGGSQTISLFENGRFQPVNTTGGPDLGAVRCFAEDPATGAIWAGTDAGLFRNETGVWREVADTRRAPITGVLCLRTTQDGSLWIGKIDGGLLRWRADRVDAVAQAQGLPVRAVTCILDDGLGYWWLGSHQGVARCRRDELERVADGSQAQLSSHLFNLSDGLASIECTGGFQTTGLRDSRGVLWFATLKGVAEVDPRKLRLNPEPPPVVIEEFGIRDARDVLRRFVPDFSRPVVVAPGARELAVRFTGVSLTAPEKMRFSYLIEGLDQEWRDASNRRIQYFYPPPPGTYRMRIKAANNDGVWNETGASVAFTVQPFYWQTLWFRALVLGGLIGGTGIAVWRVGRARLHLRIERLEQEAALEQERARFASVMEATSDVVGIAAPSGRALFLNRAGRMLLGLGETENVQALTMSGFHPAWAAEKLRVEGYPVALRAGVWSGETALLARDGREIPVSQVVVAHKTADGTLSFFSTILRDITDRRQTEEALRQSERTIRAIFDQSFQFIGMLTLDGRLARANETALRFAGIAAADVVGKLFWETPWWAHSSAVQARLRDAIQRATRGEFIRFETTHPARDGSLRQIDFSLKPVRSESGEVIFLIPEGRDVTEQRQIEETARLSRQRYEDLLHSLDGIVWEADAQTFRFTFVSAQAERILGYPCQEWLDQATFWPDHIHPDDRAQAVSYCLACTAQNLAHQFEYRMVARDGRPVWLRDVVTVQAEDGHAVTLRGVMFDITNRKRVEAALRESEERYRLLVEHSTELVCELGGDDRVVYVNGNYRTMLGYESEDLIGRHALEVVHPDDQQEIAPKFDQSEARAIFRHQHKDGSWRWLESAGRRFTTSAGEVRGVIISRDITAQKEAAAARTRLEAQLRQAQKMEAIGTLAGGIAHDFNNILGAIIAYADLARCEIGNPPAALEDINQVLRASDRAKGLVRQILAFSRQQKQERRPAKLQLVINEALKLLRSALPAGIEIARDIREETPVVLADTTQIHQVVMNLCTNAAHAMRSGQGTLRVSLEPCFVDAELASSNPELRPGRYARLTVEDEGCGMDRATLKRIFEPFFTTKATGEGTGLGLAVVHGIVKEHDGAITVYSEPGAGTTFKLYLPAQATATVAEENPAAACEAGNGQRILYVDDEPALALAAQRILQRQGYRVEVASDPGVALAGFRAAPDGVDLVIADLNMPRMSGVELATQMLRTRPDLPVLLATGFSGRWTPEKAAAAGLRGLVMKPFGADELGLIVSQTLRGETVGPATA